MRDQGLKNQSGTKYLARAIFPYLLVFLLSTIAFFVVYQPTLEIMSQPWDTRSDVVAGYAQARALQGSWFGYTDNALGFPFGANYTYAFPPEHIHIFITRILVNVLGNPFAAVNYQFALSFGLCAMAFFWLAKKVIENRAIAMIMGLAFAWLPYRFIRFEYGHISLAECFLIPIGLSVLLHHFSKMTEKSQHLTDSQRTFKRQIVLAILVGTGSTYYSFYFSLLIMCTLVLLIGKTDDQRRNMQKVLNSVLLASGFLLSSLSSFVLTAVGKVAAEGTAINRSPEESIFFGGSLSRLLIPWGTWLPQKVSDVVKVQDFEWTATPLLVAIGIWILMFQVLVPKVWEKNDLSSRKVVAGIRFFSIVSILFYSTTGLGTIFAFSLSPIFRCWNRFSIIISALSLLLVGLIISELIKKSTGFQKQATSVLLMAIILSTQVLPIAQSSFFSNRDKQTQEDLAAYKAAADALKTETSDECALLQFPIIRTYSKDAPNSLSPIHMFWLPLMLPDRRWSFGAPAGTKAGEYWPDIMKIGISHAFHKALELDVCGIVIDRRGYETDQEWYRVTTRWQELANFQAKRISDVYFFVSFESVLTSQ
jgi:phosphoglycerol transferase